MPKLLPAVKAPRDDAEGVEPMLVRRHACQADRPDGATIVEIAKALDWQAHTVRGVIADRRRAEEEAQAQR